MTTADKDDEKPLDPAVDKVRRRLMRFMAINLGILFIAVMVVLAAIVYKLGHVGRPEAPAVAGAGSVPTGEGVAEGRIALPFGSRIVSHSLSGDRLTLDVALADGGHAIFVYDIAGRRMIGRFDVATQP